METRRLLFFILSFSLARSAIKHTNTRQNPHESLSDSHDNVFDCLKTCFSKSCSYLLKSTALGIGCAKLCEEKCSNFSEQKNRLAKNLGIDSKNICTNGQDPSKMKRAEYLLEFAKGPCSPVVMASGFMGSKIVVKIDCQELRRNEPEVFSGCGWNSCEKHAYEFWKNAPNREYLAWIPDINSPISILTFTEKSNFCFVQLMKILIDLKKPIDQMYIKRHGVSIVPYGFSEKTHKANKCGANAIVDLLSLPFQTNESVGFKLAISNLDTMGFISGLTYQALPYNFFLTYHKNEFQLNFAKSIERLRRFTGKKVVIYAHSFGNLNTLFALKKMSLEEKQRNILNWISVTPPFSGAPKSQRSYVTGDDTFSLFGGKIGFHFTSSVILSLSMLSTYNLRMYDPFTYFSGQPWLEKIQKRMDYERKFPQIPYEESGIPFWPRFDQVCHQFRLKGDVRCFSGLYDTSRIPLFIYKGEAVYVKDDLEFFTRHPIHPLIPSIYKKMASNDLFDAKPGVPVLLVFMNTLQTPATWSIEEDPNTYYKQSSFPDVKLIGTVPGDKTVPSVSQLILPLKWAMEFDENPKDPSNQPVKFIEFSSLFKTDEPIYDNKGGDSEYKILKNGYIGLKSECMDNAYEDDSKCHHPTVVGDGNMVSLLMNTVIANQKVSEKDMEVIKNLTPKEIEDSESCMLYELDVNKNQD